MENNVSLGKSWKIKRGSLSASRMDNSQDTQSGHTVSQANTGYTRSPVLHLGFPWGNKQSNLQATFHYFPWRISMEPDGTPNTSLWYRHCCSNSSNYAKVSALQLLSTSSKHATRLMKKYFTTKLFPFIPNCFYYKIIQFIKWPCREKFLRQNSW